MKKIKFIAMAMMAMAGMMLASWMALLLKEIQP